MAKAVRAKKSGVKAKATTKVAKTKSKAAKKKTARPAAKAPSKAKSTATKKKTPAKARKPAAKKTARKTPVKKTAPAKPAAKKSVRRKSVAGKAPATRSSKPKAAPKPKSSATPKPAPRPKAAVAGATDWRATPTAPVPPSAVMPSLPAVGQKAPDFSLPADNGSTIGLASLAGKTVVLYFYPKDDTPGCTIEAIAFSNLRAAFEAVGAVVIGVSKDSVDAHCKFKGKHSLSIPLLSDESGKMLEKYGVWVEKNLYGRTYMGIDRTTFLIDRDGIVRRVWPKVKVEGHADEVLAAVKSL